MTDLLIFLGYILIFMAVHHGRTNESKIDLISWRHLVVFSMVLLGSLLLRIGHEKQTRHRIEIQTDKPVSQQQTSYKL